VCSQEISNFFRIRASSLLESRSGSRKDIQGDTKGEIFWRGPCGGKCLIIFLRTPLCWIWCQAQRWQIWYCAAHLIHLMPQHFSTEIPLLAPRWKYQLSKWPLSRGRLIPGLAAILFFSVSQFLLQVLSRTFTPPPPFLESAWCVISYSPWSRVLSFSFRVYHDV